MPLTPGSRLGHYEIIAPLGAGGMGEVYRARDPKLEREVAIKVLPTESLHDDTARARLLREARLAATLNHPNVCTVFEVGEAHEYIYLAMELIEGVPLSEKIAERGTGLPTESVVRYGAQIAAALAHAHERHVIHRDLKGSNVVVTPDGRVKVLDLGVARRMWEGPEENAAPPPMTLTEAGAIVGTPHYLAPEVLVGRKADERSDVWALGVLMHEMASGSLPFKGATSFELASSILHALPAALPDRLPAGLRAVITRCLAKEPGERYERASEVRAALETIGSVESSIGSSTLSTATPPAIATPRRASRLAWWLAGGAIAAIAVAAVLWFGGAKRTGAPHSGSMTNSLAVLPFVDMSQAKDQEYFSDGLAEELLNVLAKTPELKVAGRTSSFSFKGKNEDLRSVARKLGVANILEGSVRKSGDRIRITAQLVKATDGFHVWSETYDRKLDDIFAVQDEIAGAVAAALKVKLLHQAANPSVSRPEVEAYDLVLQARYALRSGNSESIARADTLIDRALQLAPDYAPAWAERGLQYRRIGERATTIESFQQAAAAARTALQRAIELDPRLALAYARLAGVELDAWNFAAAERLIARALELDPTNNLVRGNAALVFGKLGRIEETISLLSAIVESDPLNGHNFSNLAQSEILLDRLEPAELHARKALELVPDSPSALTVLSAIQLQKRDFPAARASFLRGFELQGAGDDGRFWTSAIVEFSAGNEPASRMAMRECEQRFGASDPSGMAQIYAWRGESDAAFAALDRALAAHDPYLGSLHIDIFLRPLHDDPRWKELLRKIGLPAR